LAGVLAALVTAQSFVALHADHAEIRQRALEDERDDARQERKFYHLVSEIVMAVVSKKREYLRSAIDPEAIFNDLPQKQTAALIAAAWEVINGIVQDESAGDVFRVRVAYFRAQKDGLSLELSWNGRNADCVSLSPNTMTACFSWSGNTGSLAKSASQTGTMWLVADADEADRNPGHPFHFFGPDERSELKSIVAMPIKFEGANAPYDVLVVDTNRPGFFDAGDERLVLKLKHVARNLAHRLHVERGLQDLARRGSDV
jgi:hypothetical protein